MIDVTEHDDAPAAPGDLELLQRFLNLHDHDSSGRTTDASPETVRDFLVARGLLAPEQRLTAANRETYLALRGALRSLIEDDRPSSGDAALLDRLGVEAGLHPHFHAGQTPTLEPRASGVAGAFGAIVAIAFLASFDGTFEHMRLCAADDCRAVFYDRSKNHSGRWCSMDVCGNRAKVRAWRERQKAAP